MYVVYCPFGNLSQIETLEKIKCKHTSFIKQIVNYIFIYQYIIYKVIIVLEDKQNHSANRTH